uniref:Prolactin-like n=1 Tax=Gouania willdenowi TaxID=441366 RepID=A0A8C5E350_GOUWI
MNNSLTHVMLCSVCTAPVCTNAQVGCHAVSLNNLFDRIIQHSAKMHRVSNDLHQQFELHVLPSRNQVGRGGHICHTSTIMTPNGKENAQRMAREGLTQVILQLLMAWTDPLMNLHHSSTNVSVDMSSMVGELRRGVQRLAEKMHTLGLLTDPDSSVVSPEALMTSHPVPWRLMNLYDILYCFRRDSNKVHNYLRILKCRIVPEHGC